jgi:hypothetical protein
MTTAIHMIMKQGHIFSYDSYDPVYAHEVRGDFLYIDGHANEEYVVDLRDVAFWEYVEGDNVNSSEYFDDWKERNKQNKRF